jgi:large subunit ribosomal protein L24
MERIQKGDLVQILRGEDRPQTAADRRQASGRVVSVDLTGGTCIVAGRNLVWKHRKGTGPDSPGGREQKEAPIRLANVMLFNEAESRPERVQVRIEDGKRVRYFRKSGTKVPAPERGPGK